MKKLLLLTAATLAIGGSALAAVPNWYFSCPAKIGETTYSGANPGSSSVLMTYDETEGVYKCHVDEITTAKIKFVTNDATVKQWVEGQYTGAFPTWSDWFTQYGAGAEGDYLIELNGESVKLKNFVTTNKEVGNSPVYVQFKGGLNSATNVDVVFNAETGEFSISGEPGTTYHSFRVLDTSLEAAKPTGTTTLTRNGSIYTGKYNFGEIAAGTKKEFKIGVTNADNTPMYGNAEFTEADKYICNGQVRYTKKLTAYGKNHEKIRAKGSNAAASIEYTYCPSITSTLSGEYNVKFDAMTGELTLWQPYVPAEGEIVYQFLVAGTNEGAAISANPNKGVTMHYNETEGCYMCHVDIMRGGFKIVSNDQKVIDRIAANHNPNNLESFTAGVWHTQFGANINGGEIVSLAADAEPTELIDFETLNKETGHSPGFVYYAGGVHAGTDVTVRWWPETKMVKVTGTPSEYKDYGFTDKTISWGAPSNDLLLTHEGNGIYKGKYTFDIPATGLINTFKIRPVGNTSPTYGFVKDETKVFGEEEINPEMKQTLADNETKTYTETLTAFHSDSASRREPGDAAAPADQQTSVAIAHSAKSTLVGPYDVTFNANTGELSFVGAKSSTGLEALISEDYAPVEYFNLQGMKVENPTNGIFVRRQGNKISKVIVK